MIKRENLSSFFDQILPKLGLNKRESQDFTDYWIPRLKREVPTEYLFVTFIPQSQIEEIDPFEINVKPETVIRVRAYFKPLTAPTEVKPVTELPKAPKRTGFTLVEWGGILDVTDTFEVLFP